jgi:hypothetical protein
VDYIDLYQKVQAAGKAVSVWGSPDEIKFMHKKLRPDKTIYDAHVNTVDEAEELLGWFEKNM